MTAAIAIVDFGFAAAGIGNGIVASRIVFAGF